MTEVTNETQEPVSAEVFQKLKRERDAYAKALTMSNNAFMEKVKEFSIVKRLADAISWRMDKKMVCSEIVEVIIDETTAENCSLWLVDDQNHYIYLTAVKGQANDSVRYFSKDAANFKTMKIGSGAAGWVAQHGKSLLIEDVTKSPHFSPGLTTQNTMIKSLVCLPISDSERVLGVLNLSHPDIGAFSKENERMLKLITGQAGIVLTNLKLLEQVQGFNRELEAKVEERTQNLRRSEERFERAVKSGKVGIWDWSAQDKELHVSTNLENLLNLKDFAPEGVRDYLRIIHPADRRPFLQKVVEILKGARREYEGEQRMGTRRDKNLWFFVRAAPVHDDQGRIIGVSGSHTDITIRKEAQLNLEKAQEEALLMAHAQGRAEFANTVLHNVGNVLNSVNVNSREIRESMERMGIAQMFKALELIRENKDRLGEFFERDERGRQLPDYLQRKADIVQQELTTLKDISADINGKIMLMRDVIESQQAHATRDQTQAEDMAQLIGEALKVERDRIDRAQVALEEHIRPTDPILVPWSRMVHVLINLIKNAVEAMNDTPPEARRLKISLGTDRVGQTLIRIQDTGCGVAPEHMHKMFTHGFTTRKEGHGFGLHYCAKAIREMGGDIVVTSEGRKLGACFTIMFPASLRQPHETPEDAPPAKKY